MIISLKRFLRKCPIRFTRNLPWKQGVIFLAHVFLYLIIYWLYGVIFTLFCIFCIEATEILYKLEDVFVYHPVIPTHSRIYVPSPSMFNLPYQTVYIHSKDGTILHTFFISQPGEEAKQSPTILYLHGNAGNIGHRLINVAGLYHKVKCNILVLEYRGYGFSQGTPTESGLYMDAQAGLDYLLSRNDINTNEIIVFGRSLGGAIAIDLAANYSTQRIWCLILENTFTSIPEMASVLIGYKFIKYLPLFFYKNKFMSTDKVTSINVPTLFVSGSADTLVPPRMMIELYNKCKCNYKKLITISGGTHNETWNQTDYYQRLVTFINQLREKPRTLDDNTCHYLIDDI
ncbi:protein ABHD13 [Microplitis demolitor]|uniref:protein ABHD13 n=1 Tax=Microplitis demolitor TaxID=69319 RepID=UPI0004CCB11C|nr:protein ABHD13 [Microplitis demolitor]XP_053595757.1 protein ABHD13 [Microplitis demolitor]